MWYIPIEIVLAYLIGAVPTALLVGKIFYRTDIRKHGSGNAGATNTFRVLGWKAALPVMLFDVFKGWFAVQFVLLFPHEQFSPDAVIYIRMALAVAAVLGHVFPVYAGFRGGKGVGTLAGAAIALYPYALLIVLGVFIITFATTRYVSVSSIVGALLFPVAVVFVLGEHHPGLVVLSILVAIAVPLTHRKNIRRLLKGEENRFSFRRKDKK
jgi:acyl phosphate:glycerol-3-phosphate acyltransferase